ncbi:carbohydrate sulfotransferase 10-like [Ciona intestinalis]
MSFKQKSMFMFCFGFMVGAFASYFPCLSQVLFLKRAKLRDTTPLTTVAMTEPPQVQESQEFMSLMESIQKERKETLQRACTNLEKNCKGTGTTHFQRAFFSKRYQLAACDIYKSGSTTMMHSILKMNGVAWENLKFRGMMDASAKIRFSSITDNEEKTAMWNAYTKIILVRHPFERFVSGYTNKLIPSGVGFGGYYEELSPQLNKEYRHLRSDVSKRNATKPGHATFEDFLNYLLTTKERPMDGHWADYVQLCEPCAHGYDVIMKMDTLENDVRYVTSLLNLTAEHSKDFFKNQISRSTKSNITTEYFKTIPKELANRLYENRRRDFEMFGYRKPEWIC